MKKRKDGRYCTTIRIGGKQKYFYGRTPKEAEKHKKEFLSGKIQPIDLSAFKLLGDVADEWLLNQQINVKGSTYEGQYYKVERIKKYFIAKYIQSITFADVQTFLDQLLMIDIFSKSTIKQYKSVMLGIFKRAQKQGIISSNPCELTEIPKNATVNIRRGLNLNEEKILCSSADCTFGRLALFLYYTGVRKSEAIPLTWDDVDFDKKVISIRKVATFYGGKTRVDHFLKNGDKLKLVPMVKPLQDIMHKLYSQKTSCEYVFPSQGGNILPRNSFIKQWKQFQFESGLTEVTPHMLRHTCATNLFRAGLDVKTIQSVLGHRDLSVLINRYVHESMEIVLRSPVIMDEYYLNLFAKTP